MKARNGQENLFVPPCLWCGNPSPNLNKLCSKRCRQTAWRFRKTPIPWVPSDKPLKLAYADPPYPGLSKKYYGKEASYAGEVDHRDLVDTLEQNFHGWALSTSSKALKWVLALVQSDDVIVCPWVKPLRRVAGLGPVSITEYLIVSPGRRRLIKPGLPDAFLGATAREGDSKLIGRKPINFVNWLFRVLGASPVDTLADLYPGSGIVGRCWREFSRPGRPGRHLRLVTSPTVASDKDDAYKGDHSNSRGEDFD